MNPERSRLWRPVLVLLALLVMNVSVSGSVAQEDPECFVHVVRSGENLSRIAARYGTRVAELVRINEINNPSLIHPEDMLRIPAYNSAARDARARRRIPSRTDTTRAGEAGHIYRAGALRARHHLGNLAFTGRGAAGSGRQHRRLAVHLSRTGGHRPL